MDFTSVDMIERIKSKTTLKELEPLGFPSSTVSSWKTKNSFPKADDLYKIAKYLNVSMEWLLTGEETDIDLVYKSKYEELVKSLQDLLPN